MSKRDIWILCGVLLVALVLAAILYCNRPAPAYVAIYVHDVEYTRVPVDAYQTIRIDQGGGKVNVVTIDGAGVRMESSTCKNQLCVQQGTIDPARMEELILDNWIVCLPNGVTVELAAGDNGK